MDDLDDLTNEQFWAQVYGGIDWRTLAELDPPDPRDVEAMLVNLERHGRVIRVIRGAR